MENRVKCNVIRYSIVYMYFHTSTSKSVSEEGCTGQWTWPVPVLSAPTVLVQRVGLWASWRCGLTRGLLYESIGMLPVWSGGVCSRFALLVQAGYPSCVENVAIPLGYMKSGSCDLGVFPLHQEVLMKWLVVCWCEMGLFFLGGHP